MELKEYQTRTLEAFTRWRNQLAASEMQSDAAVAALQGVGADIPPDIRNYPKAAWTKLAEAGEVAYGSRPYVDRTAAAGFPIPHVCFKVPTGGGKTLLGAAALERLDRNTGLVLWMVPSNAIYRQTKEKLWDRQHPYRQMLERGSGRRVKMLEKDDLFTAADVEHYLCVMLISLQSANRQNNRDFLRMFRDSGRYMSFFPDNDDVLGDARLRNEHPDLDPPGRRPPRGPEPLQRVQDDAPGGRAGRGAQSLRQEGDGQRRVRAVGEPPESQPGHRAVGHAQRRQEQPAGGRGRAGPEGRGDDQAAGPVTSASNTDWHHTLGQAHAKLEELDNDAVSLQNSEGRYIRPIAVVRVERTGNDQRDGERIHAEDVREYLTQNLGVPADAVAVQSSASRELDGVDLLSEFSPVRWIVTKAALMEGWDCPFAYLLVMLDNTSARRAITQLVGRVMRQPHARLTYREALDQCYVYCQSTDVSDAVQYVKDALEQEGMGDLDDDVQTSQATAFKTVMINRREEFRDSEIFLPKVLYRKTGGGWEELDYQRHILPGIDVSAIGSPDPQSAHPDRPQESSASVDLEGDRATATFYRPQDVFVDESVRISWYARRISDILPNPFQAARIVQELVQRMYDAGQDDSEIYRQRSPLASQLAGARGQGNGQAGRECLSRQAEVRGHPL